MARQSSEFDAESLNGIQTYAHATGVETDLSDNTGFSDHTDGRFRFLTNAEVDEVLLMLFFPVPVLRKESGVLVPPEQSCAAVFGHSVSDFGAYV